MAITNGGVMSDPATVTVSTSATVILAESPSRRGFIIRNTDASVSIYWGNSTVTASSTKKGLELKAGESISVTRIRSAIYGIVASGTVAVCVIEVT